MSGTFSGLHCAMARSQARTVSKSMSNLIASIIWRIVFMELSGVEQLGTLSPEHSGCRSSVSFGLPIAQVRRARQARETTHF
jgi:hypothetical protein